MDDPIGVILAGGAGRRIGGAKATVRLCGKPLICYPLDALLAALRDVVVLAKPDSELPPLPGITVWTEPGKAQHPLIGIRHALALAEGRGVLVCGVDMPFVTPELVAVLAQADHHNRPAVLASRGGAMEPLFGRYQPSAAAPLAAADADAPLRDAVAAIGPRLVEVGDPRQLFNVNSPEDLLQATAILDGANRRSRSSSGQAG